ncbi:MAG: zf-HC2 domain-containing protein [Rhizobium sp.]|nr:zf-HC2 domain-containing protein [Rhizobium sp.]
MTRAISDEMLMAFADGELAPEEQEEIEKALAEDEGLAERLAVFMDTRDELAATMKPLIDEPVPAALEASLTAAIATARHAKFTPQAATPQTTETVVPLRPRASSTPAARSTGSAISSPWGMALAASFVGIVVGLGGFLLGQSTGIAPDGANLALNEALETLPSGGDRALSDAESLHMIASFRDAEGHLCREFERKAAQAVTTAVACHGSAGWQTRFALTNPVAEGYVPASTTDTLDAFLSGIGAGAPLSPEEETADIEALRSR